MMRFLIALAGLLGLTACSTPQPPLKTVAKVDLPRFMGDWYVFAHIPYSLEKGKVGTLDRYVLRKDGRIQNSFLFRRGSLDAPLEEWKGVAWVTNPETKAEWRVQFLWPFSVPYLIIDLDPDYQWAVIGYPNRKLAWVLSRKPQLDRELYAQILAKIKAQGYEVSQLKQVPQRPE
jgi:apolipoprotein D and lipocalin family protein